MNDDLPELLSGEWERPFLRDEVACSAGLHILCPEVGDIRMKIHFILLPDVPPSASERVWPLMVVGHGKMGSRRWLVVDWPAIGEQPHDSQRGIVRAHRCERLGWTALVRWRVANHAAVFTPQETVQ